MDNSELSYVYELPYWRTSKTAPDVWIDKTVRLLENLGATVTGDGYAGSSGVSVFVIVFKFGNEVFRVTWPVLRVRDPAVSFAARVQAATFMYHDCKAKALAAKVIGFRTAFIGQLMLPEGKTVSESSHTALLHHVRPLVLLGVQDADETE